MTGPKLFCFPLVALLATVTCHAQEVTPVSPAINGHCSSQAEYSSHEGVGCATHQCNGQHYIPQQPCVCPKPYTYDQAAALWANYCVDRCRHGGCHIHRGCHLGTMVPLAHCATECNPLECSSGTCGNMLGRQSRPVHLFQNSLGCCSNGCLQPALHRPNRHGINLFQGVKSLCAPLRPSGLSGTNCDDGEQINHGCDLAPTPNISPASLDTEVSGGSK